MKYLLIIYTVYIYFIKLQYNLFIIKAELTSDEKNLKCISECVSCNSWIDSLIIGLTSSISAILFCICIICYIRHRAKVEWKHKTLKILFLIK